MRKYKNYFKNIIVKLCVCVKFYDLTSELGNWTRSCN